MFLFYAWADMRPRLPYRATARAGERFIPPPGFEHTTTGMLEAMRGAELPPPERPALPPIASQPSLFPEG
jgi:hypothetical protein